jgi:hypothetical protein
MVLLRDLDLPQRVDLAASALQRALPVVQGEADTVDDVSVGRAVLARDDHPVAEGGQRRSASGTPSATSKRISWFAPSAARTSTTRPSRLRFSDVEAGA